MDVAFLWIKKPKLIFSGRYPEEAGLSRDGFLGMQAVSI